MTQDGLKMVLADLKMTQDCFKIIKDSLKITQDGINIAQDDRKMHQNGIKTVLASRTTRIHSTVIKYSMFISYWPQEPFESNHLGLTNHSNPCNNHQIQHIRVILSTRTVQSHPAVKTDSNVLHKTQCIC